MLRRIFPDPPPTAQNLALVPMLVLTLQGCHDRISLLTFHHAGSNEHLLVVSKLATRPDAPVVEIWDGRGIDAEGQFERREGQTVFEPRDQFRLPSKTLDLPAAQREGRDGYDCQYDEAGAVLLADSGHLGRPVKNGDEVGVETAILPWGTAGEVSTG